MKELPDEGEEKTYPFRRDFYDYLRVSDRRAVGRRHGAFKKAEKVLAEFGVKVPEGLQIVPLGFGELGKPGPDWVPFEIRLTNCRTVYVRDDEPPHKLREETVCFGFEIVPNRIPGGPLG